MGFHYLKTAHILDAVVFLINEVSQKVHIKVPTTIKGMNCFPDLQSGAIFGVSARFGWWSCFIWLLWNQITTMTT